MENIKLIPLDIKSRLDQIINLSWQIFINQYINKKYEINLEAPFQLHFASILKQISDVYCFKKTEIISVNLEVKMEIDVKNYVDIVLSYCDFDTKTEGKIPIELKYKTKNQGAVDEGAMHLFKDIYTIEKILKNNENDTIPFGYFFCITDDHLYINPSRKGLRTVFATYHGYIINNGFEYKYLTIDTGVKFHKQYGSFTFLKEHQFIWEKHCYNSIDNIYFLKMKIDK